MKFGQSRPGCDQGVRNAWLVAGIPAAFLVIGCVLRFAAYAVNADEPSIAGYVTTLCRWDCKWYVNIADAGYDAFPTEKTGNVGNWGFFPLYPFLVRVAGWLMPLTTLQTGTLVSMVFAYAACLVAWPLLGRDPRAHGVYAAYVLAGPFSHYFATALTESLFLLLTSIAMLMLQRRVYMAAGMVSALLSATRIVGVFFVFATVITMFEDHRGRGGGLRSFLRYLAGRPVLLLAVFVSPLGLFAYMLLLWSVVGDGFAFSNVQRAFGRAVDWPWLHWLDGLRTVPRTGWWPTPPQSGAIAVVVALTLTAVLAWRRGAALAVFCLICILLPISSGLPSIVRYAAALAPLPLTLAGLCARTFPIAAATVGGFLLLCYVLTVKWIGGHLALV